MLPQLQESCTACTTSSMKKSYNRISCLVAFAFLSSFTSSVFVVIAFSEVTTISRDVTVRVCDNKHCMKQQKTIPGRSNKKERSLVEVIEDLVSEPAANPSSNTRTKVVTERSGCLSECGKGPNISIIHRTKTRSESLVHGIDGPFSAALALKDICNYEVNKTLLAACTVMDQAEEEPSPSKKETLLTSVVSALQKHDFSMSSAMASALCLRAAARSSMKNFPGSIEDAAQSTLIRPKSNGRAWRLLFEGQEAVGDYEGAIETLGQWSKSDTQFSRKAAAEALRIRTELQSKKD